jgi:hypothetical protein
MPAQVAKCKMFPLKGRAGTEAPLALHLFFVRPQLSTDLRLPQASLYAAVSADQ